MAITNEMWHLAHLMEKMMVATYGEVDLTPETNEREFIEDVQNTIPKVEKAIEELKTYLDKIESNN